MEKKPILIVDDEKNIRLTMAQSLEPLGLDVETAENGEEALRKLQEQPFGIVFLDLRMPGMGGVEVLRKIEANWPKVRVVIITAHGTIENAVETMKLGAVDFVQKPFSPAEIRAMTTEILDREAIEEKTAVGYPSLVQIAKRHIANRSFENARRCVKDAIAADPGKPEAYNLLGVLSEIQGEPIDAQRFYRAAIDIDPTYKPAGANLERITSWRKIGKIDMGADSSPPSTEK